MNYGLWAMGYGLWAMGFDHWTLDIDHSPPRQNSWVDFGCGAVSCFPETLCGGRGGKFFDGEKPSTGSSSLFDVNREEEPVLANSFHP